MLSAALIGAFYIFHVVAMQHLIGAIGGAGDRTRNYSVYSLGIAVAGFAGPLAAGYSIDAVGHARTYLHLALLPLVPLLAWLALPRLIPSAHAQARAARPSGNSALLGNPALRRTLLIGGIIETGLELYTFYLPIYGRSIGLSATAIGAIMGAYAIAALAVRVAMPALVRMANEERVIAYSLALSAATYALFPYIRAPWLLALVSVVLGMGLGAGSPLSMVLTYNRSPDGRSGEALGLRQSVNKLTETCVPMLFGAIASMFGMGPVFWSSAALLAGGAYVLRGPRG